MRFWKKASKKLSKFDLLARGFKFNLNSQEKIHSLGGVFLSIAMFILIFIGIYIYTSEYISTTNAQVDYETYTIPKGN